MDLGTLKGLSTIFVMITFAGVCWWAFSPSRRKKFKEAANLPFADDAKAKDKKLDSSSDKERQDKL